MDHKEPALNDPQATDLDSLAVLVDQTRHNAERAAHTLRSTADLVLRGGPVPAELEQDLATYRHHRDKAIDTLAAFDTAGELPSDATFDDLREGLENARRAMEQRQRQEAEKRERAAEVAAIEQQIRDLEAKLEVKRGELQDSPEYASPAPTLSDAPAQRVTDGTAAPETNRPAPPPPGTASATDSDADAARPASDEGPTGAGSPQELVEPPRPTAPAAEPVDPVPVRRVDGSHPNARDELEHGFPWEQGDPPLAVHLVASGRLAEAYWVTTMSGEPDRRASALRFAAAAFGTRDTTDATAVQAALDIDSQSLHQDNEAATVVVAALLRVSLIAGWAHPLLNRTQMELTLPSVWDKVVEACVAAAQAGHRIDQSTSTSGRSHDDGHTAQQELRNRAETLLNELPRRKNAYERASRVLRRLAKLDQPLGCALQAVIDWADGSQHRLSAVLTQLNGPDADDVMIEAADAAVRTPRQAKEPIVSAALRGLRRAIDEVRAIAHEAEVVDQRMTASVPASEAVAHQLTRAVNAAADAELPNGMAGAVLSLLLSWLRDPATVRPPSFGSASTNEPSTDALLPLADLPRDPDGRPDPHDAQVPGILASLREPLDLVAAVRSYCERGDLRRVVRLLELVEQGCWSVTDPAALRDIVRSEREKWDQRHKQMLVATSDLFARIRGLNLLDQTAESNFARRIESLSSAPDNAYDQVTSKLREVTDELSSRQEKHIQELRENLREQYPRKDTDRSRIETLLDEGDTVTAAEFLSFLRAGEPLPTRSDPISQGVASFADLLSAGQKHALFTSSAGARRWADLASELKAEGRELAQPALDGVTEWDGLSDTRRRHSERMANALRSILTTLGLQCPSRPRELDPRARRGFRRFRVDGRPTDDSYVSALGSAATDFTVTLVFDERRGRSVLGDLGHEDVGRANIVLYFHPLDLGTRRSMASDAPNSPVQALLIDPAVMGWVAVNGPGSWRATQRVTLPWTAFNPYTPFVAGLVPPEVFVGRKNELAQVTDAMGGLFLYGGRQLGKSALLRRVEATFNNDLRKAVYLDLKGRGIGEAEPADRIWRELAVELKSHGVIGTRISPDGPIDVVVQQVRDWLNTNQGRRLLVLADEADAFLAADSRSVPTAGGAGHFPNVLRLKELMESTGRRFKVVFAGLHQVQRFGHLSNVPLAHGGPDIPVGPLDQRSARTLVEDPLAALGYTFAKPELVWRLLSATNYQASLIQILCDELVTTLHQRGVSHTQTIPVPISEDDLERVLASDRVRGKIAERLRITINLEDRYRVLALVIVWLSLNDSFGTTYEPKELLDHARRYWAQGFDDLTVSQVNIYLDEMVGLGLLLRLPGENRYVVRSPNVVNMLGTKADLERELEETDFELPYEYNPREARRLLYTDGYRQVRSALTDGQLAELTRSKGVSVVTGTTALGVDRVSEALREYADTRNNNVDICTSSNEVRKAIAKAARRNRGSVVVADLRGRPHDEIEDALRRTDNAQVVAVVIVDMADAHLCQKRTRVEPMRPERWTASAIRSWPECPFDSVESRQELINETGGWTHLVEIAIERVTMGGTQAQALDEIRKLCTDPHQASTFLRKAGLDKNLVRRLAPWVNFLLVDDEPEPMIPADIADLLELDVPSTNDLLTELSLIDVLDLVDASDLPADKAHGISLNKVIYRCMVAAGSQS